MGVVADKLELMHRVSKTSSWPGCFERGMVIGEVLEQVPYTMARRSMYPADMGDMEQACRLAALSKSTNAFQNVLSSGKMFG